MHSMLTIGRLARRFGLSRSTLLYYDRIGLLSPSGRSAADYRLYDTDDVRRMERIQIYRQAGLPLADIARILDSTDEPLDDLLESRLGDLQRRIDTLRRQQRVLLDLLRDKVARGETRGMTRRRWVELLHSIGLDDAEMDAWHVDFERLAPDSHERFLESLGLGAPEIDRIRRRARPG
jgi:DNA-binding transcriptional MerR regulator